MAQWARLQTEGYIGVKADRFGDNEFAIVPLHGMAYSTLQQAERNARAAGAERIVKVHFTYEELG